MVIYKANPVANPPLKPEVADRGWPLVLHHV
jgi:hypothetical protein